MGFCTNCGVSRAENTNFCMSCGTKFEQAAPASVIPPPAPPNPEVAAMPEWLNQPEEAPAPPPPPAYYQQPQPIPAPAPAGAYMVSQNAEKQKMSPLSVVCFILLGLALYAGGFFGVHFLLNNVL